MKKPKALKGPWTSVAGTVYDQSGYPLAHVSTHQGPHRAQLAAEIAKLPTKDHLIMRLREQLRSYIHDRYDGTKDLKILLARIP